MFRLFRKKTLNSSIDLTIHWANKEIEKKSTKCCFNMWRSFSLSLSNSISKISIFQFLSSFLLSSLSSILFQLFMFLLKYYRNYANSFKSLLMISIIFDHLYHLFLSLHLFSSSSFFFFICCNRNRNRNLSQLITILPYINSFLRIRICFKIDH